MRVCECGCVFLFYFQELDFAFEDRLKGPSRLYLRGMKLIRTFQHIFLRYTSSVCLYVCVLRSFI